MTGKQEFEKFLSKSSKQKVKELVLQLENLNDKELNELITWLLILT